ncbi:MAG: SH3 domain-containing protein [Eubacteriales bacterium]|nr:SH3 domain-containing protein [Eubacteriales bacterium]
MRTSPYTSADEITRIPLGAEVDYIEAKKDFYLVSYNGQIGYALQSYLTFI